MKVLSVFHFWDVSYEVVRKIEGPSYVSNRERLTEYLLSHPFVAKIALLISVLLENVANNFC